MPKLIGSSPNQVSLNGMLGNLAFQSAEAVSLGSLTVNTLNNNPILNAGTAGGVVYLNASKVATSSSNLAFDGYTFSTGLAGTGNYNTGIQLNGTNANGFGSLITGLRNSVNTWSIGDSAPIVGGANASLLFYNYGTLPWVWQLQTGGEQMRLTSTGLGIGTSSPIYKLQVAGTSGTVGIGITGTVAANTIGLFINPSAITGEYSPINSTPSATDNVTYLFANTNSSSVNANSRVDVRVTGAGGGDPKTTYTINGVLNWSVGVDNSDSDKFKISCSDSPGTSDYLTIDTSGNLGIGTSSPGYKLDVQGASGVGIQLYETSTGNNNRLRITQTAGITNYQTTFSNSSTNAQTWTIGGSELMRLTSTGDLLVGTTASPSGLNKNGVEISNGSSIGRINIGKSVTGSQYATVYYYNGNAVGNISYTDTATAYNTSSDYRLKDNPQPLTNSGAFIDALQPKTWGWKADGSRGVGFIAHEVQAVSPSSVVGEKDAVDVDGKPVMQAMEYGSAEFIANIIAELKALRARVAALEAQP